MHPRSVSNLRNLFADYFAKRRELGLEGDQAAQRRMPEFFLSFPTSGISPSGRGGQAAPLTLHIYSERDLPAAEALETFFKETLPYRLDEPYVCAVRHGPDEREQMYEGFSRTGVTYYLHPAALRTLAGLNVAADLYGALHLALLWAFVLLWVLLIAVAWSEGDWSYLPYLGGPLTLIYALLRWTLGLAPVQMALSAGRRARFAQVIQECREVGRRALDADLAAELPLPVLERLSRLPGTRPAPQPLLGESEWRLAEIWDLSHQAAQELTKIPESSPRSAQMTAQVCRLLDTALQAFAAASEGAAPSAELDELYAGVTRHAAALGVGSPARPLSLPRSQSAAFTPSLPARGQQAPEGEP